MAEVPNASAVGGKTGVVRGGKKAFLCTEKGYYIPLIYWAEVPDTCAVGVGVENWGCAGIWCVGKNCACAGEKMLPEVMCCLEREKKRPQYRIVAQIIPRGIVGKTTPQHYPRPNRLQIRKFRIVARLPRVRPRQKLEL